MPKIHNASTLVDRHPSVSHMAASRPTPGNSPFLKQLASSSSLTRAQALEHLRQYLRTRTNLTPLDHLKLWKGLFYCVWHSDRPRAQQTLARDLAGLVHVISSDEMTADWLGAFWETMAREWSGIPALRMDKFLYLCRMYVQAGFEWCKRGIWKQERLEMMVEIVQKCPLSSEVERSGMTNGLRFHVIDVWMDEVDTVNNADDTSDLPLEALLSPLRRLRGMTKDKTTRKRIDEALDDDRLKQWVEQAREQDRFELTSGTQDNSGQEIMEEHETDDWNGIEEG